MPDKPMTSVKEVLHFLYKRVHKNNLYLHAMQDQLGKDTDDIVYIITKNINIELNCIIEKIEGKVDDN